MIEIWERVKFLGWKAISWERSFDAGRTWEQVPWPLKDLPFVRCVFYDNADEVVTTKVMQQEAGNEQSQLAF